MVVFLLFFLCKGGGSYLVTLSTAFSFEMKGAVADEGETYEMEQKQVN